MNSAVFLLVFLQQSQNFLFRSEKVYTVLSVMLIIWVGVLVHLFWLGKKVNKLEHRIYNNP